MLDFKSPAMSTPLGLVNSYWHLGGAYRFRLHGRVVGEGFDCVYRSAWPNIPDDWIHQHCCENHVIPTIVLYVTSRVDSVLLFNTITRQSDRFMHQTFINDRNSGGQIVLGTLKFGNISPACWKDHKFCLRFPLLLILHKSTVKY